MKVWKRLPLLLIVLSWLLTPNACEKGLCAEKLIGIPFEGSCGYYSQNFSLFAKDNKEWHVEKYEEYFNIFFDYLMFGQFDTTDTTLRFLAVPVMPHLFSFRDEEGFTIYGPHYSVIAETAKHINYT